MAFVLTDPEFSFLNFTNGGTLEFEGEDGEEIVSEDSDTDSNCCITECNGRLPVFNDDDLAFQVLLTFDTVLQANDFMLSVGKLFLVKPDETITDLATLLAAKLIDFSEAPLEIKPMFFRSGRLTVIVYWPHGLPTFKTVVAAGNSFRVALLLKDGEDDIVKVSNLLFRTTDNCYTTKLTYSCEEDTYDFVYCGIDFVNKIRLPFYLSRPQYQDEETVYPLSDGSFEITKSITKKEYLGNTEFLSETIHGKLKVALSHDKVEVSGSKYTGGIRKNGNYDISWDEDEAICIAPAKFKALVTPFAVRNDNCADCKDWTCDLIISNLVVVDGEQVGGNWVYKATWAISDLSADYKYEYSLDNQVTWFEVPNFSLSDPTTLNYSISLEEHRQHHFRITPKCDSQHLGTPAIAFHYDVCPPPALTSVYFSAGLIWLTWLPGPWTTMEVEISTDSGSTWINGGWYGSPVSPRSGDAWLNQGIVLFRLKGFCPGSIVSMNSNIKSFNTDI